MKHQLGISVYPDLRPLKEIKEYFKLASQYGVSRVFSSMFSVEGTKEEVLAYFREMIEAAHEVNMKVSLDVNPMCFKKMQASVDDLSVFADIKVDILRMDMGFGPSEDIKMINNSYGIILEFNSSASTIRELVDAGADPTKFYACHNFYPQRYTGLRWDKFLELNKEIKKCGPVRIGAFISSNAKNTHGVWDAVSGLPTVERLRDLPIDLQARILLATGHVDDLLIGNAYASEEEFKALQEILEEKELNLNDPTINTLIEYGIISMKNPVHKKVRITLDKEITDEEKKIIFEFYPHMSLRDGSEWMWRSRMPRFVYSQPNKTIPHRSYDKEYFEIGDVVIVNDNYKHYCGELQVVTLPMKNDGTRNKVGYLDKDELMMMELVDTNEIVIFLEKE